MIGEIEKRPSRLAPYALEEVEKALNGIDVRTDKMMAMSNETAENIIDEFKRESPQILKYHDALIPVIPKYHNVHGVRFMSHLTPHKLVMFENHYILTLKSVNESNEPSFVMKDLPLNDQLIRQLIDHKFPIVKVTKYDK